MNILKTLLFFILLNIIISYNSEEEYLEKLNEINFDDVKKDLFAMFKDSKEFWPADYGNYAPFFIRLAWHCAGSYRQSDGRGGCDGAWQRFDPERSWDDNTNLDKARSLLLPIKQKYGSGLSWGDLIILSGNAAIESMGGPVLGFCAGRVDDEDNTDSVLLGPTAEQEIMSPCTVNGKCKQPLGPTTIGLIYVNPEGPMGNPIPEESAKDIRDSFGRMSMNDEETVALIGGGHAFGKTHGACPLGPGDKPKDNPEHPWEGNCGEGIDKGKGKNAFTSGFEGPWTTNPLKWDNTYFHNLLNYKWEVAKGPGDHYQWNVSKSQLGKRSCPYAPKAHGDGNQDIMMLTSDIALTRDIRYLDIVYTYAQNPDLFGENFSKAWYKLVTRDMGPITRCVGKDVPPAQPFQYPLPPPSQVQPDWNSVKDLINKIMTTESSLLPSDKLNKNTWYGAWFVKLAWQCASTFRKSDYLGGCNGARIRFSPQKDWKENFGMEKVLGVLTPIKQAYGDKLSWADLIVLAGNIAIEKFSGQTYNFCPGRSDATDGSGSEMLDKMIYPTILAEFKDRSYLMGLTNREAVALQARFRSLESQKILGYKGTWMKDTWGSTYFKLLINEKWNRISDQEFVSENSNDIYMMNSDFILVDEPYLSIVQEFAGDEKAFYTEFQNGWTKLMNADRFDGPTKNLCDKKQ